MKDDFIKGDGRAMKLPTFYNENLLIFNTDWE